MPANAKRNKLSSLIVVVFFIFVVIAVVLFGCKFVTDDINGNRRNASGEITVSIPAGSENTYDASLILENKSIIKSDTVWSYWMDKHYPDFEFVAGEYILDSSMSYEEIVLALKSPTVTHRSVSVCIPEGYDVFRISQTLEDNGVCKAEEFLDACRDKSAYDYSFIGDIPDDDKIAYQLEGFLFPATYDFYENMDAVVVVDDMLSAFADRITPEWREFCDNNGYTMYELVTLASIVERETLGEGVAENIASVFINRLEIGQKLQSDVTIDYGNSLRKAGFSDDVVFSYNTYKCDALPSGPVCNAGEANINAVVNHSETDYFYFFSDLENQFHFAEDYDEFESLKKEFPWQ